MSDHPSFLALDLLAAGLPGDATHVARCARCAAHLDRLRPGAALPASVRIRAAQPPAAELRPWWRRPFAQRGGRLSLALTVLLAIFAVGRRWTGGDDQTVRAKGGPGATVYVLRAGKLFTWDGSSPIQPGDLLRLRVVSGGCPGHERYKHVSVTGAGLGGEEVILYRGPMEESGLLLPDSWQVDGTPGPERLQLVLSERPLDSRDPGSTEHFEVVLPKQAAPVETP